MPLRHSAWPATAPPGSSRSRCTPEIAAMKLTQLRYLLAVVDHGTVSAAGAALHVAQPAVSRAVRSLEQELGIDLFARSGRGMALTDAGTAVVEQARRAVAEADAVLTVAAT